MFSRIANLFKGFLSLFVSGLERQNPKALIEAEKENLRVQIARFNENLANHAGFAERLLRQVKNLEAQERDVRGQGGGQPEGRQPQRGGAVRPPAEDASRSSSRRTASSSRRPRPPTRSS